MAEVSGPRTVAAWAPLSVAGLVRHLAGASGEAKVEELALRTAELRDFGDRYRTRRNKEADYVEQHA